MSSPVCKLIIVKCNVNNSDGNSHWLVLTQ